MNQKIGPPALEEAKSLQRLINSGTVWIFPGTYGRAAILPSSVEIPPRTAARTGSVACAARPGRPTASRLGR